MTATEPGTQPITLPAVEPGTGDPGRPPAAPRATPDGEPPAAASRWWLLLGWLVMFLLFASHDIGKMTFDTKLGVDIDPVGFYQRLATLWNPLEWFGGLQDQYIGYAFPMGAFYLLGHVLTVPVWLVERLWMSVLVAAGFWGLVRLAERLGVGGPRGRLLAGAVFALWPTFTIVVGSTSAAVLPGMLIPWAVLPLAGRTTSAWVAAARSGVVVLAMGGVNAVSTIAALVVPALYLVTRPPGPRRRALILWWVPAVLLATAWWLSTLFFQKAYGFDFLPYIEQAANTTQTMSASSLLRGSGNWTAYLNFGSPWLTGGWAVVATVPVIAAAVAAAAVGLYGLGRRDLPEGRWLRLGVGIAALVTLAGYGGPVGGLFHGTVQHLLDGSLAPFRNIYKFEPVVAFGLVLGLAHGLAAPRRPIVTPRTAPVLRWGGLVLAVALLLGLSLPDTTGQVLQPGAFASVPSYWQAVAGYLGRNSPRAPAMVVPADSHGIYTWGMPVDEPLEPLADSPWVQRDLVPFSSAGATDMLTAAEQAMESGMAVPGLATYLARAGIRYVVVRNDLDPTQIGYTQPGVLHTTLAESGFHRVASFGPPVTGGFIYPNTPLSAQALMTSYPSVEVFTSDSALADGSPVTTQPTDRTVTVAGDPGALLQLADQGLLTDQPVVTAGQQAPDTPAATVVTDAYRRQDHAFGLVRQNTSYTYTAAETNPVDSAQGDGGAPPRQMTPVPVPANQTVAVLRGAADVTASSYGSWLWLLPEYDPVNAFDGDARTAWAVGRPDGSTGQWLRIGFDHRVDLPAAAGIDLLDDTAVRPLATKITVTTEHGSATTNLARTGRTQRINLPAGPTTWLRLTIDATTRSVPGGLGAGITDVHLPGVRVTRFLQPAQNPTADATAFSFHRDMNPPQAMAAGEPESLFARTFTTTTPRTLRVTADAMAVPGDALNALLDAYRLKRSALRVSADSVWGSLPQFRAANLIDGNYATGWVANGPNALLRLSWPGRRSVKQLFLQPLAGLASAPTSVRLTAADGQTRTATVRPNGEADFPALTTDQLDITFPTLARTTTYDPVLGTDQQLPVGLSELYLPALADLRTAPPYPTTVLNLPCGQGPPVTVDGTTYQTSASGRVGALTAFTPIRLALCTAGGALRLGAGRHTITSPDDSGALALTDLLLGGGTPPTAQATRMATVLDWGAEHREVGIAAGDATYLEVHQSYNAGWTATLNGGRLTPVVLDGWQQGFVVPAGDGGVITLSFPAGGAYRTALVASGAGVMVLVVAAVLTVRSGRRRRQRAARSSRPPRIGERSRLVGALVAVAVLFVIIGGWAAVLVPILAALGWLRPAWLPWIAGGAMVAAGVCTVIGLSGHVGTPGYGAFGAPAQVFALAALAAALVPVLRPERSERSA
ncbi:MAG TPA: alpha-(1-_3)-arabinofuranosyltransferase family protein [Pseudonocardiaceae bacterium]|nr:alpha-(1->3)-arabinofuranosyltransferase family protein [Pseudonocardiaceae bacterium]